jgi:hypothetical protein
MTKKVLIARAIEEMRSDSTLLWRANAAHVAWYSSASSTLYRHTTNVGWVDEQNQLISSCAPQKYRKTKNVRMIKRVRNEPLNARDSHRTLPRDLLRKLQRRAHDLSTRTIHDARHQPKPPSRLLRPKLAPRKRKLEQQRRVPRARAPRRSRERANVRREPDVDLLDAEPGIGRGPAYVEGAQRVQREAVCQAVHRCYYGLWDAGGGADGALEGADVGARLERASGGVCVLGEREQLGHWCFFFFFLGGEGQGVSRRRVREGCFGVYARSMPAENTLSFAEDRTTTRTVGSSAIQPKAAPYSRQNLPQRKKKGYM